MGENSRAFAKACCRSPQGKELAPAYERNERTRSKPYLPYVEFVGMGGNMIEVKEYVAAAYPCCDDRSTASSSEPRKGQHCARPGHVSFGSRSHIFAVEIFERLGGEGTSFIEQLAARIVVGRGGGSLARRGVCKERLSQIISVTTRTDSHLEEGIWVQALIAGSLGVQEGQGRQGGRVAN